MDTFVIKVKRKAFTPTYTIGDLYLNGVKFCNTLEDPDRKLTQNMPLSEIKKAKVYGNTAIPKGTYEIDMDTISPKYSKNAKLAFTDGKMPRLVNVPGWEGVLIHSGNTAKDTLGCVLVGNNNVKGMVTDSLRTFTELYGKLKEAHLEKRKIIIVIE